MKSKQQQKQLHIDSVINTPLQSNSFIRTRIMLLVYSLYIYIHTQIYMPHSFQIFIVILIIVIIIKSKKENEKTITLFLI